MIPKTLILIIVLLLAIAGFIAAASNRHWWKTNTVVGRELPAAPAEYAKLMARYQGFDSAVDLSGTIRIYDEVRDHLLKETRTFRCFRLRGAYYWQLSYLQTFCDGRFVVQLDTVDHVITVSKAIAANRNGAPSPMQAALLFSDTARFHLSGSVEAAGAERKLTLQSDYHPEIRECRVFYDTAGYRLRRLEIEWWKGGSGPRSGDPGVTARKIWLGKVDYDQGKTVQPDIPAGIASIVSIKEGQVDVNGRYQGYTLNVNL